MCPSTAPAHPGQDAENEAHRGEVVELHGALEVVEAVDRQLESATNRVPGVVDQHVDATVLGEDALDDAVACLEVGEVDGVLLALAARCMNLGGELGQGLPAPREQEGFGAERRHLARHLAPDPARGPGDDDHLAVEPLVAGRLPGWTVRQGVEVIFPVLPDAVCVALEWWARDPGAG